MSTYNQEQPSRKCVALFGVLLAVSGALLLPGHALAQTVTMDDGGSTATVDLGSSAGMNSWTVNGQNQLNQQWFWYQTDGGIAQPINTIGTPTVTTSSGANGINNVTAVYQNSQLSLTINYSLSGGGVLSGNAAITESIMAVNLSGSALNFNFYQYSAFNLLGAGNDTVQVFGGPGAYDGVRQANGSTAIQEAVIAPNALYAEAANIGQTLNELDTVAGLTLNDNTTAGPGIETWALQWDQELAADGGEFDLTKNKSLSIQVVPEPSTIALFALGLSLAGLAMRRKAA